MDCFGARPDFLGLLAGRNDDGDRAGILACGGISKAIRAQVKISVDTNQFPKVRAEDLIEQAFKVSQGVTRFQAMLIRWRSSTPPPDLAFGGYGCVGWVAVHE